MEITATVCSPEGGDPETEAFSTLESGMRDLVAWLRGHGVTGAAMEATGWELPYDALEDVGIRVDLCAARQAGPENGCRRQHVAGPHLPVRPGGSEPGPAA